MIDLAKLEPVLGGYQTYFPKHWPHVEDFKWEAAQHFHDHWNIDAADFGEMFKEATAKVFSLLDTGYAYPRAMILNFAAADCEATRAMFRSLFDESTELSQRIIAFQAATEEIRTKYNDGSWNNHYQNTSAISVYLWLRYPDQYYIYRYSVARDISDALNFDAPPKRDGSVESLLNSYRLYDELRVALSQNAAITQMIRSAIEAAPAGKYWPDTHWNIAAIDLGFYLSRFYLAEQKTSQMQAGWFPAESEYDPGITTAQWSALLQDTSVFTSEALRVMKCMLDYGGQATCKQLAIKYGETSNFYISHIHTHNDATRVEVVIQRLGLSQELRAKDDIRTVIFLPNRICEPHRDGGFDNHDSFRIHFHHQPDDSLHRRRVEEVFPAIIIGGSRNNYKIGLFICHFCIQCCGQVKVFFRKIFFNVVILNG